MTIYAGGTALPSASDLSIDDEQIWTSDSGRDLSGLFSGDVIAEKKTLSIGWEYLTETEVSLIKSKLTAGYIPVTFEDCGEKVTLDSYRGTLSRVFLGTFGGVTYYKSVTCKIVQR